MSLRASLSKRTHLALPAAALLCVTALQVSEPTWVVWIQHRAFDAFQQLRPRPYSDAGVRVIDLDDESLARLGQWPWPRTQVAKLERRLQKLGAAATAYDIFFPEADRTSPRRLAASWPEGPEFAAVKSGMSSLPDHDSIFAQALRGGRAVLGCSPASEPNNVVPAVKSTFVRLGDDPMPFLQNYAGAVSNLPQLEAAAAGVGNVGFEPELDQVVRTTPLLLRRGEDLLPALSIEALRVAQGEKSFGVKSAGASGALSGGEHTGIVAVNVGGLEIPTDERGRIWVYYTKNSKQRTIPAWRIFEKGFDRAAIEGAICLIGTSASGLKDIRATPLNPVAAGVDVHANILEQIVTQTFLKRPDWALGAEAAYLLILGALLLFVLSRGGALWAGPLVAAAMALSLWLPWRAFTAWGWLLDPIFPPLGLFVVYATWSAVSFVRTEIEKRNVTDAFGKSLHPKLVAELSKHPDKLVLGGETREITILFCDIRGFTTISEQYDAQGLTAVINRFLTPMSRIIMERFGYIDKYIGDCIMAFWNAPSDDADHARNACRSVLEMRDSLKSLNETWKAQASRAGRKHVPVNIGLGLNTGPCCVGYMGSDQKLNYTTLGDDVNLASRLEGQSKSYHVDTVIGPRTRELASDFAALELDLIKVKGKTKPVRIFTLVGDPAVASSPEFQRLGEAHRAVLEAYRRQDWDGVDAASAVARPLGEQFRIAGLYDLYVERAGAFRANPPGSDWDGVFTATSK